MSERILVGTRKGLFTIEGQAGKWAISRLAFQGDRVSMVLADPRDGTVYAALDHGHFGVKMHRSRDGGATFEECGTPVYPEASKAPPTEPPQMPPGEKPDVPWKLILVWALEPGHRSEPGVLWCGTLPGGLFRSADGGATWELNRPLWDNPMRREWMGGGADHPGIHSICVHPQDGRRISIGISCGGVWQTTDGGQSWACRADGMIARYMPPEQQNNPNIQDPHRVVQCPAQPNVLWAQHHNGVFRSTDGSVSWYEIKDIPPSIFGFAVAVHPTNPDVAWFVPATNDEKRIPVAGKVVVSRTRDGGKSFTVHTDGLPQQHAYDIVYRHCLDVDATGNRLAFGSTTGSLWISENQGDSWQSLSEHLPPVYCVRFVK